MERTPSDFFHSTRGLRQSDLLSPYLFLLVMEILSQQLFKARSKGFIEGFKVGSSGGVRRICSIFYLLIITFLFCKANSEQLRYLSWVFLWFEAIFGLKVNRDKSEVIPVGRVESLKNIVLVLGCRIRKLPSYLGLLLGALRNGNGAGLGRVTPIPFPSQNIWLFPISS